VLVTDEEIHRLVNSFRDKVRLLLTLRCMKLNPQRAGREVTSEDEELVGK
jgi:hypothetical protein